MSFRLRVATALVAAFACACSSSSGSPSDSPPDASAADASAADATAGDAAPADAGSDSPADALSPGCSAYPGAFYCDDFEEDITTLTHWSLGSPPRCAVVETPTAYSGDTVMRCTSDADAGTIAGGDTELTDLPPPSVLRVAFSARIDSGPTNMYVEVDQQPTVAESPTNVELYTDTTGALTLHEVNYTPLDGGQTDFSIGTFTANAWHRIDVILDFTNDTVRVGLDVPAAGAAAYPFVPGASGVDAGYQHALILVAGSYIATSDTVIDFDDVVAWSE